MATFYTRAGLRVSPTTQFQEVFIRGVKVRDDVLYTDPKTGKQYRVRSVAGAAPSEAAIQKQITAGRLQPDTGIKESEFSQAQQQAVTRGSIKAREEQKMILEAKRLGVKPTYAAVKAAQKKETQIVETKRIASRDKRPAQQAAKIGVIRAGRELTPFGQLALQRETELYAASGIEAGLAHYPQVRQKEGAIGVQTQGVPMSKPIDYATSPTLMSAYSPPPTTQKLLTTDETMGGVAVQPLAGDSLLSRADAKVSQFIGSQWAAGAISKGFGLVYTTPQKRQALQTMKGLDVSRLTPEAQQKARFIKGAYVTTATLAQSRPAQTSLQFTEGVITEPLKKPVTTGLTFVAGAGLGGALKLAKVGTASLAFKGATTGGLKGSAMVGTARGIRLGGKTIGVGLGALYAGQTYARVSALPQDQQAKALGGIVSTEVAPFVAGGVAIGKSKIIKGKTDIRTRTDIYRTPQVTYERVATVGKGSGLTKIDVSRPLVTSQYAGRATPQQYAIMLQQKGKIYYSSSLSGRSAYKAIGLGKFDLGGYAPKYIDRPAIGVKAKFARPDVIAHELIHYKTRRFEIPFESKLPYRLQPSEILAYGGEAYYGKYGFKVSTSPPKSIPLGTVTARAGSKDVLKTVYPRQRITTSKVINVDTGKITKVKPFGKQTPIVSRTTGVALQGGEVYKLSLTRYGKVTTGQYKNILSFKRYGIVQAGRAGKVVEFSRLTGEPTVIKRYRTGKTEPFKVQYLGVRKTRPVRKDVTTDIGGGIKVKNPREILKSQQYKLVGRGRRQVAKRTQTEYLRGEAAFKLRQTDKASTKVELYGDVPATYRGIKGKTTGLTRRYTSPTIKYALQPTYKPDLKTIETIGIGTGTRQVMSVTKQPRLLTQRITTSKTTAAYRYVERRQPTTNTFRNLLTGVKGKRAEVGLTKGVTSVQTKTPRIDPKGKPLNIIRGREISVSLGAIRAGSVIMPIPRSVTRTPTRSRPFTETRTPTIVDTPSITRTPTETRTPTITKTPAVTITPTITRTPTIITTQSITRTLTPTVTVTPTTPTITPTTTTPPPEFPPFLKRNPSLGGVLPRPNKYVKFTPTYVASVEATFFGITGKAPKSARTTGLELRPIARV